MEFSGDGRILAAGAEREIRLFEPATGALFATLRGHESLVNELLSSRDGTLLASASTDHTIRVWELGTGVESRRLERKWASLLAFTPDTKGLLFRDEDGVWLWDFALAACIPSYEEPDGRWPAERDAHPDGSWAVTCSARSPDARVLAVGRMQRAALRFDAATGFPLGPDGGHRDEVFGVAFAEGERVVSVSRDGTIRTWDAQTGEQIAHVSTLGGGLFGLGLSSDGRFAVTLGGDDELGFWDLTSGRRLDQRDQRSLGFVAFAPDARTAWTGTWSGQYDFWNLHSGTPRAFCSLQGPLPRFSLPLGGGAIWGSANGHAVLQWGLPSGRACNVWTKQLLAGLAAVVSPDGRYGVAPEGDSLRVLGLPSLDEVARIDWTDNCQWHPGTARLTFSPDGRILAATDSFCCFRMYEFGTWREIPWTGPTEGVAAVAFSQDGKRLATAMRDTTILLWPAP